MMKPHLTRRTRYPVRVPRLVPVTIFGLIILTGGARADGFLSIPARSASGYSDSTYIEAEFYDDYWDADYPPFHPEPVLDGYASGGYAIDHFDRDGMWLEFWDELDLDQGLSFEVLVRSAGRLGLERQYYVEFFADGHEHVDGDTLITPPGQGAD